MPTTIAYLKPVKPASFFKVGDPVRGSLVAMAGWGFVFVAITLGLVVTFSEPDADPGIPQTDPSYLSLLAP